MKNKTLKEKIKLNSTRAILFITGVVISLIIADVYTKYTEPVNTEVKILKENINDNLSSNTFELIEKSGEIKINEKIPRVYIELKSNKEIENINVETLSKEKNTVSLDSTVFNVFGLPYVIFNGEGNVIATTYLSFSKDTIDKKVDVTEEVTGNTAIEGENTIKEFSLFPTYDIKSNNDELDSCNIKKGCYVGIYSNVYDTEKKEVVNSYFIFATYLVNIEYKNDVEENYIVFYAYDYDTDYRNAYIYDSENYTTSTLKNVISKIIDETDKTVCENKNDYSELDFCNFVTDEYKINEDYYKEYNDYLLDKINN